VGKCFCGGDLVKTAQCWQDIPLFDATLLIIPRSIMLDTDTLFLAGDWKGIHINPGDWIQLTVIYLKDNSCSDIIANGIQCVETESNSNLKSTNSKLTRKSTVSMTTPTLKKSATHPEMLTRSYIMPEFTLYTLLTKTTARVTDRARVIIVEIETTTELDNISTSVEENITIITNPTINHRQDITYLMIWETQTKYIVIGFSIFLCIVCAVLIGWTLYSRYRR
jgi:hypothetical protein